MERTAGGPATLPGYKQERDDFGLTKREREVRGLLATGLDQQAIAEQIGLTKQRVSQIVKSLSRKGAVTIDGNTVTVVIHRSK